MSASSNIYIQLPRQTSPYVGYGIGSSSSNSMIQGCSTSACAASDTNLAITVVPVINYTFFNKLI
jgi:hypothetical protein